MDEFEGREPIPGLEHLGRAIVDDQGVPSGSPANFEYTRGEVSAPLSAAAFADIVAALKEEYGSTDDLAEN